METASVRLTPGEKKLLEKLVEEGVYKSLSEAIKAGIYQLLNEYKQGRFPWKNRDEVRAYFEKRDKRTRGLEDLHDEEEESVP